MVIFLDILFFAHVRASARDTNFGFFKDKSFRQIVRC